MHGRESGPDQGPCSLERPSDLLPADMGIVRLDFCLKLLFKLVLEHNIWPFISTCEELSCRPSTLPCYSSYSVTPPRRPGGTRASRAPDLRRVSLIFDRGFVSSPVRIPPRNPISPPSVHGGLHHSPSMTLARRFRAKMANRAADGAGDAGAKRMLLGRRPRGRNFRTLGLQQLLLLLSQTEEKVIAADFRQHSHREG